MEVSKALLSPRDGKQQSPRMQAKTKTLLPFAADPISSGGDALEREVARRSPIAKVSKAQFVNMSCQLVSETKGVLCCRVLCIDPN